jgi:hypothetical protein
VRVTRILIFVLLAAAFASAQATRTWVSGVGDDANPCSRTAPCKTWAGAISKTANGGEIDALDPGGFGAVTITKSITLDGGGGQVASILVAGTNGVVVAAQPTDIVILRNLRFDGLLGNGSNAGNAGLSAIRFISGKGLIVENCVIFGFNNAGIDIELGAAGNATILNTNIENIGSCAPASCLTAQGVGIFATSTAGTINVEANHVSVAISSSAGIQAGTNAVFGFDYGTLNHGFDGARTSGTGAIITSNSTIAYNSGTAYKNGNNFVFATVTGGSPVGTNRAHDNGATGTPTYILLN